MRATRAMSRRRAVEPRPRRRIGGARGSACRCQCSTFTGMRDLRESNNLQKRINSGKNLPLFSIPYTTLNGGATEAPIHWLRTHAHTNTHDTHANANTHTWRATRHILIVSTPRGTHRCSPSSALARANLMCALRRHSLSMSVSNFFNIGLSLSVSFLTSSYSVQLFSFVCSFSAIARSDCDWPSISFTRLNI